MPLYVHVSPFAKYNNLILFDDFYKIILYVKFVTFHCQTFICLRFLTINYCATNRPIIICLVVQTKPIGLCGNRKLWFGFG